MIMMMATMTTNSSEGVLHIKNALRFPLYHIQYLWRDVPRGCELNRFLVHLYRCECSSPASQHWLFRAGCGTCFNSFGSYIILFVFGFFHFVRYELDLIFIMPRYIISWEYTPKMRWINFGGFEERLVWGFEKEPNIFYSFRDFGMTSTYSQASILPSNSIPVH